MWDVAKKARLRCIAAKYYCHVVANENLIFCMFIWCYSQLGTLV